MPAGGDGASAWTTVSARATPATAGESPCPTAAESPYGAGRSAETLSGCSVFTVASSHHHRDTTPTSTATSLIRISMASEDTDSFVEKMEDKFHDRNSDSESDSDSDDDHVIKPPVKTSGSNVYRLFGRGQPVHKVLGGGKPADILLWRNRRSTGIALGAGTAFWVFFEMMGYHLITFICHLLIMSLAALFL